jgi:lysophospholipase L1-like esterase
MRTFLAEFPDVDFLEINGFTYPKVFSDRNLYKDSAHLNGTGAEIFSRMVAKAVRERIEKR